MSEATRRPLLRDRAALAEILRGSLRPGEHRDRLQRALTIDDLRRLAQRRLPRSVFGYLEGGAGGEQALRANVAAFSAYCLRPGALVDVSRIELSTDLMGRRVEAPIVLAPIGLTGLMHHEAEPAAARAAARHGVPYTLSSVSTRTIEEVASVGGPRWFQLYVWRDRRVVANLVTRAKDSGYDALCLTVDVPVAGRRLRDVRTGLTVPPRFGPRTLLDVALHPSWWAGLLSGAPVRLANVPEEAGALGTISKFINTQFDPGVDWADLDWLVKEWGGRLLVKGVMDAAVARRAVDAGAGGIVVSNHGGRQLDRSPASLDVLGEICEEVGTETEVLVDGGIRSGGDVAVALALGAKACLVGRAYMYGLAAGGEAGVDRAISILVTEMRTTLALMGCTNVADLGGQHLVRS